MDRISQEYNTSSGFGLFVDDLHVASILPSTFKYDSSMSTMHQYLDHSYAFHSVDASVVWYLIDNSLKRGPGSLYQSQSQTTVETASKVPNSDVIRFFTQAGDVHRQIPIASRSVEGLVEAVIAALNEEPLEDGEHHPAEALMESALRQDEWRAADALQSAYASNANQNPELAARLLRCMGRLRPPQVEPWGRWLAAGALVHRSVLLRTAAVRALEMWGDEDAVGVLRERSAREPVQWLARYMRQVVQDLSL